MFLIGLTWIVTALISSYARNVMSSSAEAKNSLINYFHNIPDVESRFIMDNHLARTIARLYNNSIGAFPVFDVSVKIDRNPVVIPWDIDGAENNDINSVPLPYVVKQNSEPAKHEYTTHEPVGQAYADPMVEQNKKIKYQLNNAPKAPLIRSIPDLFASIKEYKPTHVDTSELMPKATFYQTPYSDPSPYQGQGYYPEPIPYAERYTPSPFYAANEENINSDHRNNNAIQYAAVTQNNRRGLWNY